MATGCIYNVYSGTFDRGARVTSVPEKHIEVDEKLIEVGKPLPKWMIRGGEPVVKAYDGTHIELDVNGKMFSIKVGEEVQIDESEHNVGYGVYARSAYCVKLIATQVVYKGEFQTGSTIQQKLTGPIGEGEVSYPNGDHFKGYFHLSYASINGPAYAAEGRYEFADGSYIEKAWIHTSEKSNADSWGLHGVFRIHHPDGSDSIAMFCHGGKRYGFELFLPQKSWEKPWVREWYAGDRMLHYKGPNELFCYEVESYEIDETSRKDCTTLRLTLKDGNEIYQIEQKGGDWEKNRYGSYIYKLTTRASVVLPSGDSLNHYGFGVREMKPYDGYIDMHDAKTGMYRSELWENGKLKQAEEWKRDERAAKSMELPNPFGKGKMKALVWKDGYIDYNAGEWTYEGETAYGQPQGKGVLTGNEYRHEGERYEGDFQAGRCHGRGIFVNEKAGITQDGQWIDGTFQEPNAATAPIMLHARYGRKSWSIGSSGEWKWKEEEFEAETGSLGHYIGGLSIARIERGCITLTRYDRTEKLTPGKTVSFYQEVEDDESSDGCVYSGTDYQLQLTWKDN